MSWPIWLAQRFSAALWTIGNWGAVYSACLPCWSCRSCQCRMKREMAHQLWRYVFHAWAATEINAHQRTDYLAELISDDTAASLTQCWVDNGWKHGVKFLHDWKNSSKRCEFLRFNLYFCHVILEFCLFSFCNTKISEFFDMAKSWAARLCRFARRRTFCWSGTYK